MHVLFVWPIQHGVNLAQKEVSSLEEVGSMFDLEHCTNPPSLFRGEPSISSNFQVFSKCRSDIIRLVDASNWPTSRCGKRVKRPSMFKLTHQQLGC
jgi:hypothetical protein